MTIEREKRLFYELFPHPITHTRTDLASRIHSHLEYEFKGHQHLEYASEIENIQEELTNLLEQYNMSSNDFTNYKMN